MNTKFVTLSLAVSSAIAVSSAAALDSQQKTVVVDGMGTKTESTVESSTSKTITGATKKVESESVSVDPKGLGNKAAASKTKEEIVHNNGDYKVTDKMVHPNGTYEENSVSKSTNGHWTDEGKTIVKKEVNVVDPKGLGNKVTTETVESTTVNPDGSIDSSVTKSVNGQKVEQKQK